MVQTFCTSQLHFKQTTVKLPEYNHVHLLNNYILVSEITHYIFSFRTPVCLHNIDTIPSKINKGFFDVKFANYSRITSSAETITFPYKALTEDAPNNVKAIQEDSKPFDKVKFKFLHNYL